MASCFSISSGRIAVCNQRYIEIDGLSPDVVRPAGKFRDLIPHRRKLEIMKATSMNIALPSWPAWSRGNDRKAHIGSTMDVQSDPNRPVAAGDGGYARRCHGAGTGDARIARKSTKRPPFLKIISDLILVTATAKGKRCACKPKRVENTGYSRKK